MISCSIKWGQGNLITSHRLRFQSVGEGMVKMSFHEADKNRATRRLASGVATPQELRGMAAALLQVAELAEAEGGRP